MDFGRYSGSRLFADPPFLKVPEERLPTYLNPDVDYQPSRQAISAGQLEAEVIDDFLTPDALEQVRNSATVDGLASPVQVRLCWRVSARRICQRLAVRDSGRVRAALGEAFD